MSMIEPEPYKVSINLVDYDVSDAENKIALLLLGEFKDTMRAFTRSVEAVREDVAEVKERVARIEERDTKELVAALSERLSKLEADRQQRRGATMLVEWLAKYAPWLLAGIAAFAAGAGWRNSQ